MSAFWRNSTLDFLEPSSKVLGIWGENLEAWILKGPGCVTGDGGATDQQPLFEWAAEFGAGLGIWQVLCARRVGCLARRRRVVLRCVAKRRVPQPLATAPSCPPSSNPAPPHPRPLPA